MRLYYMGWFVLALGGCGRTPATVSTPEQPSVTVTRVPADSAGSYQQAPHVAEPVPKPRREDQRSADVCEAVFRHQFALNASAAQQRAAGYYLSVLAKDPS